MANQLSAHTYVLSFGRGAQSTDVITCEFIDRTIGQFAGKAIHVVAGKQDGDSIFGELPVGEMSDIKQTEDGVYIATCLLDSTIKPEQFAIEPVYTVSADNSTSPYCLILRPISEADSFACFLYSPDMQSVD